MSPTHVRPDVLDAYVFLADHPKLPTTSSIRSVSHRLRSTVAAVLLWGCLRRSAPKVLHMPRTGSSCRILPRPEGYLDSVLRAASDLYPTGPPFDGLNALVMPKRDLQVPSMSSLQRVLGSKRSPMIGLSSESRARATISAVQDFWCRPSYKKVSSEIQRSCRQKGPHHDYCNYFREAETYLSVIRPELPILYCFREIGSGKTHQGKVNYVLCSPIILLTPPLLCMNITFKVLNDIPQAPCTHCPHSVHHDIKVHIHCIIHLQPGLKRPAQVRHVHPPHGICGIDR